MFKRHFNILNQIKSIKKCTSKSIHIYFKTDFIEINSNGHR